MSHIETSPIAVLRFILSILHNNTPTLQCSQEWCNFILSLYRNQIIQKDFTSIQKQRMELYGKPKSKSVMQTREHPQKVDWGQYKQMEHFPFSKLGLTAAKSNLSEAL